MPLYAVWITPLLQIINVAHELRNADFADDLSCADRLVQLRLWWDNIVTHCSPLGYYPRADKSWLRLIVKAGLLVAAEESFAETDRCALIHRRPQVPWWSHRFWSRKEWVRITIPSPKLVQPTPCTEWHCEVWVSSSLHCLLVWIP
jgi:hypothetical protein